MSTAAPEGTLWTVHDHRFARPVPPVLMETELVIDYLAGIEPSWDLRVARAIVLLAWSLTSGDTITRRGSALGLGLEVEPALAESDRPRPHPATRWRLSDPRRAGEGWEITDTDFGVLDHIGLAACAERDRAGRTAVLCLARALGGSDPEEVAVWARACGMELTPIVPAR